MALDLFASLQEVTAALDDAAIEYALVGGLALAVHGVARATTDIDLLVRANDLQRAVDLLKTLGFPFVALPQQFSDGTRMQRVSRVSQGETLTVDLLVADVDLATAWDSRSHHAIEGGGGLWVLDREALIAMKLRAGRPQDLVDVQRLQEIDR